MAALPHVTVATVVENEQRFLMVKEWAEGRLVYNQPAGHLEKGESILAAARRETLEETGWQIELEHLLGVYQYDSGTEGISFVRFCFSAKPLYIHKDAELDEGIVETCWLAESELQELCHQMRSPLVLKSIEHYLHGPRYPLTAISQA